MTAEGRLDAAQKITQGVSAWERSAYLEALELFDEVLAEHPHYPDVHHRAGLCKAMLGDLDGALACFDRALELAPSYAEAYFNRAIVLNDLGRHAEAEAAFKQAQALDTRDGSRFPSQVGHQIANAHSALGDLYLRADSPREAVEQYRSALEVRPRFFDVRERLAEALLAAGENEEAVRELQRVLEEEPGFAEARLRLGVALQRLGNRDRAVQEWNRVRSLRPNDRRVLAYLASAGEVQGSNRAGRGEEGEGRGQR
jgi:tetratricopeptide (TPR) repeat protein